MNRQMRLFSRLLVLAVLLSACNLNQSQLNTTAISGDPSVRIVSPLPNATYLEGVPVNIVANVSNAGANIDRVEVLVDGGIVATLPQPNSSGAASFSVTHGWSAAGMGAHTIDVIAFRPDGSSSAPAPVNITVVSRSAQPDATATTNPDALASVTPRVTGQPATADGGGESATTPTSPSASATPTTPTASFAQGVNVRRGPGLVFDPPIGAFAAGQTTEILAVNFGGDWYKVRYGGGEGWVYAPLVSASGNLSGLRQEAGPAVPTAAPTAIPLPTASPAPQTTANLVAGIVELNPASPTCAQTINIGFDVANLGSQATSASSTVAVQDVRAADGSQQATTVGGFPVIQPGQTFRVTMALTVSTWYNEDHRLILIIDPNNAVPETNESDNRREVTYRLERGSCP
jgi:hypothetical protein